jgi:hypothetical protein
VPAIAKTQENKKKKLQAQPSPPSLNPSRYSRHPAPLQGLKLTVLLKQLMMELRF